MLDAAWKMFFEAQEPKYPETDNDQMERLEYINSGRLGYEEKDALAAYTHVSRYEVRNNRYVVDRHCCELYLRLIDVLMLLVCSRRSFASRRKISEWSRKRSSAGGNES